MDLIDIRSYCLKKPGVSETYPFDEETPVFKVMSKMFLLASVDYPSSINIKCDPEEAVDMRERHDAVIPGYHMNKKYWNTVYLDGSIDAKIIFEWIDKSYELVKQKLKKTELLELEKIYRP